MAAEGLHQASFVGARGVAVDLAGNIYVADTLNNRIQIFDSVGNLLNNFGSLGAAIGFFSKPNDIDVDANGVIYVADSENHRIQMLNGAGIPLFRIRFQLAPGLDSLPVHWVCRWEQVD